VGDGNCVIVLVVNENDPQIAVAQPMESGPFSRHWFYSLHRDRIFREFFQLGDQLSFDSRVHSLDLAGGAIVNDQFRHWVRVPKAV
jgi:hypothetical protein